MEEKELFIRAQNGEREAREQLFGENAGLVHHVVKRFINRGGAEAEDFVSDWRYGAAKSNRKI